MPSPTTFSWYDLFGLHILLFPSWTHHDNITDLLPILAWGWFLQLCCILTWASQSFLLFCNRIVDVWKESLLLFILLMRTWSWSLMREHRCGIWYTVQWWQ
jgi:hypothetical protein